MLDLLITGGTIVDGTGGPGRAGDVAIADGQVVGLGPDAAAGAEAAATIDATGRVVSPGFVDIHTHYDAQVLWDRMMTVSPWHGVTSVVMGNCGFGVAPTRPEHRDLIVRTLEKVEGMSVGRPASRAGRRVAVRDLPRVPRRGRGPGPGHQRGRHDRPHPGAAQRARPRIHRAPGHRRRDRHHAGHRGRGHRGRGGRLRHLQVTHPRGLRGPPGAQSVGRARRDPGPDRCPGPGRARGHPGHHGLGPAVRPVPPDHRAVRPAHLVDGPAGGHGRQLRGGRLDVGRVHQAAR